MVTAVRLSAKLNLFTNAKTEAALLFRNAFIGEMRFKYQLKVSEEMFLPTKDSLILSLALRCLLCTRWISADNFI